MSACGFWHSLLMIVAFPGGLEISAVLAFVGLVHSLEPRRFAIARPKGAKRIQCRVNVCDSAHTRMVLPRPIIGMRPDNDNRDAVGDSHTCLDKRSAQMIVAIGKHKNGISVLYVLLVLQPKLGRVLRRIGSAQRVVLEPSRMKLHVRCASAKLAPLRCVLELGCCVNADHGRAFLLSVGDSCQRALELLSARIGQKHKPSCKRERVLL